MKEKRTELLCFCVGEWKSSNRFLTFIYTNGMVRQDEIQNFILFGSVEANWLRIKMHPNAKEWKSREQSCYGFVLENQRAPIDFQPSFIQMACLELMKSKILCYLVQLKPIDCESKCIQKNEREENRAVMVLYWKVKELRSIFNLHLYKWHV